MRGFLPAGAKHLTYCNVVNNLQICNSSSSPMYWDQRERIMFLSAADATFAVPDSILQGGQHVVSEEPSSHKEG